MSRESSTVLLQCREPVWFAWQRPLCGPASRSAIVRRRRLLEGPCEPGRRHACRLLRGATCRPPRSSVGTSRSGCVERFVAGLAAGPGTLVIEGEAGIGKTTVWQLGVDAAARRGHQVLASRPAEAETGLAYTGLADLLSGVDDAT